MKSIRGKIKQANGKHVQAGPPLAMVLIVELADRLGLVPKDMPGIWFQRVGSWWTLKVNAHADELEGIPGHQAEAYYYGQPVGVITSTKSLFVPNDGLDLEKDLIREIKEAIAELTGQRHGSGRATAVLKVTAPKPGKQSTLVRVENEDKTFSTLLNYDAFLKQAMGDKPAVYFLAQIEEKKIHFGQMVHDQSW